MPPLNLPSVIRATFSPSPCPTIADVGANISLIPGPPTGPSFLITTTLPALISLFKIDLRQSSSLSKIRAGPFNTGFFTPLILATQPSEAKLPFSIAK